MCFDDVEARKGAIREFQGDPYPVNYMLEGFSLLLHPGILLITNTIPLIKKKLLSSLLTALASSQAHTQRTAAHTAGCPVFAALRQLPGSSFPQLSSADRPPTAPSPQQAVDYRLLRQSLSALPQHQRRCHFCLLHAFLQNRTGDHFTLLTRR
jgi:hypothetical protein